ncbi:MAG: site-specific DNA-methyltransferase [Phycisphaerales bacterium]|jgi:DNA modification methylase
MSIELNKIYQGDWIKVMADWPDKFVQTVITSPPYWGLRDYGVDGQLGLEPTPEEYIDKLVKGFREIRRVLRKDGTVWLNLGDSYMSHSANSKNVGGFQGAQMKKNKQYSDAEVIGRKINPKLIGLKDKDLCMIPARVALALQADGWWLRSDIIWAKPNPMPESCTDRPTKSYEHIFLLTKSAKYFYDADAVREPHRDNYETYLVKRGQNPKYEESGYKANHLSRDSFNPAGRNLRDVWTMATQAAISDVSYGRCRIASQDCPVSGHQVPPLNALGYDGLPAVFRSARNLGIDARPGQVQVGDYVAIPVNSSELRACDFVAISHNNQIHKNDDSLKPGETYAGISSYHIENMKHIRHCASKCVHIYENNIAADAFQDVLGFDPLGEKTCRIVGILTSEIPPSKCTCYYTEKLKISQEHYASFPEELVNKCILAGTAERACGVCGAAWARVVEKGELVGKNRKGNYSGRENDVDCAGQNRMSGCDYKPGMAYENKTLGFRPSCDCGDPGHGKCIVFDPFCGTNTVGYRAQELGRDWIGIELSANYKKMGDKRVEQQTLI